MLPTHRDRRDPAATLNTCGGTLPASPGTGCAFPFLADFCTFSALTIMILLIDIGNTHTHLGLASQKRVRKQANIATALWFGGDAMKRMKRFVGRTVLDGAALCS